MLYKEKIKTLFFDQVVRKAYIKWIYSRFFLRDGPIVTIAEHIKIGGWKKFSEYLCLRSPINHAELTLLHKLINENKQLCIADVGANLGVFSLLFATNGDNEVHAFEAVPETFVRFQANIKRNNLHGRITSNCLAVSNTSGVVTLRVQYDSPATNRIVLAQDDIFDQAVSYQQVGSISLDRYSDIKGVKYFDFAKIDVEGHEPMVLRGANRLYQEGRIKLTLLEICPKNLEQVGFTLNDLYNEIEKSSCNVFRLTNDGGIGEQLSLVDLEKIVLENVVMLPKDSFLRT